MKKKILFIICALFIFPASAFAEETQANSAGYFKHVCGWQKIEQEKIYTESEKLTFHLDSEEMTKNLNARVMPLNASEKDIDYSSDNENVAVVDEEGNVSAANRPGKAVIHMSSGKASGECTVEVIRGVTGISLDSGDITFYADEPITSKLGVNVYPSDATNKNVKWRSADTSIAGVDENGVITPCGIGSVSITAESEDGGFTASCIVRVTFKHIRARAVYIENAYDNIPIGSSFKAGAYVYPENASDKTVTWQSSNPEAARVDGDGTIYGVGEGMSVITLTGEGGIEDSFTISVVPPDANIVSSIISEPVKNRINRISMPVVYTDYSASLAQAVSAQMKVNPTIFTTSSTAASESDVRKYMDPKNFRTGTDRYQFADLSSTSGISEEALNAYLSDKGILKGRAAEFIEAAEENHISEIYLAVHAALETGNGTSQLARGVNHKGNRVYNMFGIGAYDKDPIAAGTEYADSQGWYSPEAAIKGGAKWISEHYLNSGQNTLYKMRWNPKKPGTNQYASDIAWAVKQSSSICHMFEALPDNAKTLEIPVYSGEAQTPIDYQ